MDERILYHGSKEIVECINEEARKGRLYRLTDTGKEVLESINEKEEENWNCTFHTSFNNYIFLFLCFLSDDQKMMRFRVS